MLRWRLKIGLIATSFYKWREPRYLLRGLVPNIVKYVWFVLRGPGPRHRIGSPGIEFWGHSYVEGRYDGSSISHREVFREMFREEP